MAKRYFIIEFSEGSDKSFDGFRADTKPILNAIKEETGDETEIVFYRPDRKDELFEYLKDNAKVVISRINPGNLKEVDDYFQFLKKLSDEGVEIHTHPDVMINLNFKDILAKLKGTPLGDDDTYFYNSFEDLKDKFPVDLDKYGTRVLKINYGSTGEGVYLVSKGENGKIDVVEAVNNDKTTYNSLDKFLEVLKPTYENTDENALYFKGKAGFVGCRFLSRISEGEIRVLLVNNRAVSIVHKKPQEGEFSATLFSGAKYKYESPDEPKWKDVVELTINGVKENIKEYLGGFDYPLLWTMDYILDYDENGKEKYVLSEINCSCVGITTELQYAKDVAKVFSNR